MSSRLYIVQAKGKTGVEDTVLVEAQTAAQALRFVTNEAFEVRVATSKETMKLIKDGCKVHDAAAVEQAEPTTAHGQAVQGLINKQNAEQNEQADE